MSGAVRPGALRPGAPPTWKALEAGVPVLEWDDASMLEVEIRKYDAEKETLKLLGHSWRAIAAGGILLPLAMLPALLLSASSGLPAFLSTAAFLAGSLAVVAWGTAAAFVEDVDRQRARVNEQVRRVEEQLEKVDSLLDV